MDNSLSSKKKDPEEAISYFLTDHISRYTAGKFVTLLWSLLSFYLIMSYQSNLRAHLIATRHEKALYTWQDIADHASRVYVDQSQFRHK